VIASLPMYDRPETAAANDRLWASIRDAIRSLGVAAPEALDRGIGLWEAWQAPDLLLSQACGLPYRTRLHGRVTIVATPICDLPGVPAGHYHSVIVARRDDPRRTLADFAGARIAVNDGLSQSGWAAPMAAAAAAGIAFGPALVTGAHRASAAAVAEGRAELAAIDGLTWSMIRRWDACALALQEIGTTPPTPALPWITARADLAPAIGRALDTAIAALPADDRAMLGILGATRLDAAAYLAVPNPPALAAEAP
jgi:ABC-type phosphate/phosphonate transport system substrate-binding protein